MSKRIQIAVVTGGGHGIGRAICRRLGRDGVRVVVADLEAEAASSVAAAIDGVAHGVDVSDEAAVRALVENTERDIGPIDLFVSNAGVGYGDADDNAASKQGGMNPVDDRWEQCWNINVMAHVYAARALLPRMIGIEDDAEMIDGGFGGNDVDGILTPDEVADCVVDGIAEGRFMILPHPQVATYLQRKSSDYDRWIAGMQRFRRQLMGDEG
jgi:NAD(P)-dependent dehydrogenase (short-subunit alcohol dehydrogenase family)